MTRIQTLAPVFMLIFALALAGCAGLTARDPVRMYVVGIEQLPGQGMEIRFNVKLRLQNPNGVDIPYDGLSLELDLGNKPVATGVSGQSGSVPRFGEAVVDVPITVSTAAAVRLALGLLDENSSRSIPYTLRGKLAGGAFGGMTFSETGTLDLADILRE